MEAKKNDLEKVDLSLLPPHFQLYTSLAFQHGVEKYGRNNYLNGMQWSRLYSALQRHLLAFWCQEEKDPESGLPHLAHASASLAMLVEHSARGIGEDNRHGERLKLDMRFGDTCEE